MSSESDEPGALTRRTLLRAAAIAPVASAGAFAIGPRARAARRTTTAPARRDATLRIAVADPVAVADPWNVSTPGARLAVALLGDHLAVTTPGYALEPGLAASWRTDETGLVWTFTLRTGVVFHDGSEFEADDVVSSFRRLLDPANPTIAGAPFAGVLAADGVSKVNRITVRFRLLAPTGSFPYLVSSENPGAVIVPTRWRVGTSPWFVGTGPFVSTPTTSGGLAFTRFAKSWRPVTPRITRVELRAPVGPKTDLASLSNGELDVIAALDPGSAASLRGSARLTLLSVRTAAHAQVHLNNDIGPLTDRRVREAIALAVDRTAIANAVTGGYADPGDDSPVAPVLPAAPSTLAPRPRDLAQAKALLRTAGFRRGFDVTIASADTPTDAAIATTLGKALADVGIRVTHLPDASYFETSWMTSEMGITQYGHRVHAAGVLGASLVSDGAWNAAHYRNAAFDAVVRTFTTSLDLTAQRNAAATIRTLLQKDTPVLVPYFANHLAAAGPGASGIRVTALDQLDLRALR